mgnify:CR=1 FL=1
MTKPDPQHVVVVGAGIVGVSAAIWLLRKGVGVTIVDREAPGSEQAASFGNAGILAACSVAPVTAPGMLIKSPKMLLDPNFPLFLRWSYLPRLITHVIDTPIMADESVFDPKGALYGVQNRIADIFSLKIMKSGGIRRALEVAAIARAGGIEVYGGCMFETGLAHAAGAHLMAAVPDLLLQCEFYMASYYAQEDILTQPFPVGNGRVHVPTGPGLGVTVDPAMLAKYAVEDPLG